MLSHSMATPPDNKPTQRADAVTTLPDTKIRMDPDSVLISSVTNLNIASDSVTRPDIQPTILSEVTASPSDAKFTATPDTPTSPADQANFASLPREIRDKIYRLALPYLCHITLRFSPPQSHPSRGYRILSPKASNSTYANEARAMFFNRNIFHISNKRLQVLLGDEGISFMYHPLARFVHVRAKGRFNPKLWLRNVVIEIKMEDMDELAGRIGLLFDCPALRDVAVVLFGGQWALARTLNTLSSAFQVLAEKLGRRLKFSMLVECRDQNMGVTTKEHWDGNLEKLKTLARRGVR